MNNSNYNDSNFIVHDGNRIAFDFVISNFLQQNNIYMLTGASKSGKTYLCNIWKKTSSATFLNPKIFKLKKDKYLMELENTIRIAQNYILEDLEKVKISEEQLLLLINTISERDGVLLITSTKPLSYFSFNLDDLNSRFKNILNIKIQIPNEEGKKQILLKLLTDRQLTIDSNKLNYICDKLDNNYQSIIDFVNDFEKQINKENVKKLKINFLRKIFGG